jgi:hypothetical protein
VIFVFSLVGGGLFGMPLATNTSNREGRNRQAGFIVGLVLKLQLNGRETATERARGISGIDASSTVHYALTLLVGLMVQAAACFLNATEASPGVVN